MKLEGKTVYLVSIGSGYRAHPLDKTIDDKFFMLLDNSPFGSPPSSDIETDDLASIFITGSRLGTVANTIRPPPAFSSWTASCLCTAPV